MENEKSVYEDEETNCYQISDEEEEDYGKNEESQNNSDNSNLARGPYERAWTTEATRALIHIRGPMEDEFSEGRAKRTMLWIQVTKQLHKMGFRYSAAKVQKKWHNILITYNKNISRKEETGSVSWEFFEDMYIYLKGKKAKTFEFVTDSYPPPHSSNHKIHSDHQRQLQYQMQQQHRILQKQKMKQQQEHSRQQSRNHSRTDKTEKNRNSIPSTSHDYNDSSNNNDDFPMVEEEEINQKRQNDESYDQPKAKIKKHMNGAADDGLYEPAVDRLPLEISHVEGATDESKFEEALEEDPFLENDWWKDYFYKKLDTDRERIDLQKQIHRDQMSYNKMCLMQQEKIERIKIEAINNLTATLQKLVEGKGHKKI